MEYFTSQDPRSYSLYFDISICIFDFGPEKLTGLSRNGPLGPISRKTRKLFGPEDKFVE